MYDVYSTEVYETQGKLFEIVNDMNIDTEEFVTRFMHSKLRNHLDIRQAYYCNLSATEMLEIQLSQGKYRPKRVGYDPIMCNWVGEFYQLFADFTGLPSSKVIRILPFKKLYRMSLVLHDMDIKLAVDKVASHMSRDSTIKERV